MAPVTQVNFHTWSRLLSCHGLIYIGEGTRSTGKSFPARQVIIRRFMRRGEKAVWLRRTGVEIDDFISTFPNEKWAEVIRSTGYDISQFRMRTRKKRTFLQFRYSSKHDWADVMRFGALSDWKGFRDTDDPKEWLLYLDEAFATVEQTRLYNGNEVEDGLDIFRSLRHDATSKIRFLIAGNPERATNVWLDYFGIKKPKIQSGIVALTPTVNGGRFGRIWYERIAPVQENALDNLLCGTAAGDFLAGRGRGADPNLILAVPPGAKWYINLNFGRFLSVWVSGDYMIFSRSKVPGAVIRPAPDGGQDTIIWTPKMRERLGLLRNAWIRGRVRFSSEEAGEIAMEVIPKLI